MGPKQKIIQLLNHDGGVVSGETLSAELGVSRVSIWKHIKGLVQQGVPIQASPKGYRLATDPDSLHPYHFASRQDRIHFYEETESTMDEAMRLARNGCPDYTVAVALRQTRGRGRMQRVWSSDAGGLYFTVVVRPDIPLMFSGLVNLAAAVDMADTLKSGYAVAAGLKWPNDILVNEKKICGILSQMEAEGDQVGYLNIGLGLNVNNQPESVETGAVSLKSLLGRSIPRREILVAFLDAFEKRMESFDPAAVIQQWKLHNLTLGKRVHVATVKETVEGLAVDLDAQGGLILQLSDGTLQTVVHGDCFHGR
ncbi:biotin--[acetyl-CoA-carboxylase] ligase [uncultured Desulfosarcina sp.]|uniref:biotin--[acetyl-CoA-carboxylase] ligase n=1 Tax=uncultured Desulfosarcina sp. TaxID=218289 RepID=UPI0029C63844|nr:biotin--[acetyl-CoA-carboxylase] ligase [uncultured Desulfosarcina sp.]